MGLINYEAFDYPLALTSAQWINIAMTLINLFKLMEMPGIEQGPTGCEAQMLPLCYATPHHLNNIYLLR